MNEEALRVLLRIVDKKEGWTGVGVSCVQKAKQLFLETHFDIVLLNVGINKKDENELVSFFNAEKENSIIIQHYGGGSGLLYNEIQYALEHGGSKQNFIDDGLGSH